MEAWLTINAIASTALRPLVRVRQLTIEALRHHALKPSVREACCEFV